MSAKRVVITGISIISPAGNGKEEFWKTITAGKSCVRPLSRFIPHHNGAPSCAIAAEIPEFTIDKFTRSKIRKYMDRAGAYAVAAAIDCLRDSQFGPSSPDYELLEIYFATCCGAQEWVEREFSRIGDDKIESLHPHTSVLAHPGNVIGLITILLGTRGRGILFSNLDLAGTDALECAVRRIQSGASPRILVGAADAPLTPLLFGVFEEGGILSHHNGDPSKASRPFDRQRDGLVLAEGAVMLLLEDYDKALCRNAHIYAEIRSCASTFDCRTNGHVRCADKILQGKNTISNALTKADANPSMVSYIHADGASMLEHDKVEAACLQQVFGRSIRDIPVSSTKSVLGHALSVSPLFQSATCALIYEHKVLPPLANYEQPDPDCALNFVLEPKAVDIPNMILQHTHSVLQQRNAAVIFQGPPEQLQ